MQHLQLSAALGTSGLESYLAEVRRLTPLSEDEVGTIFILAAAGDAEARERIVMSHLPLVVRIAFQYGGYGLPLADLVSEGNLGLLRAAELFDPKFGVAFSTYASVWIKQRIHRAITAQARVVRIPVWRSQRLRKLDRLHSDLNAELGRDAELTELADRIGLSEDALTSLTGDRISVDSLDAWDEPALDALADEYSPHPVRRLSQDELREEIMACLNGLDDTELQILSRKFGLLNDEPESYREMAPRFGKSREWIRKIGEGAVAKLRGSLNSVGDLPRHLVAVRQKKAQARLRKLTAQSASPAKLSVWNMALMHWLEPIIAII